MKFVALDLGSVNWHALDAFPDRMFSQRRGWLEFVAEISGGTIIIAELREGLEALGYFSGILFHRFGIPIIGSPFKGWTTSYTGFNLRPGVPRREAVNALKRFAFHEVGCLHLELRDRYITMEDVAGLDVDIIIEPTYVTSLLLNETDIFARMKSACRRCIRKAEKMGVIIEEASPDGFADEYYEQLIDVFSKQNLSPPYAKRHVQALIDYVCPSGDALLLRAKTLEGEKIASAIYFGHSEHSLFWGNGSLRTHQILRPNESLHWYALRYWKRRGIKYHDWCGPNDYKLKYGPELCQIPRVCMSRSRAIKWGRNAAYRLYSFPRVVRRHQYLARLGKGNRTGSEQDT